MKGLGTGVFVVAVLFSWAAQSQETGQGCSISSPSGTSCEMELEAVHPTQFSAGMIEVRSKAAELAKMSKSELQDYLKKNPLPGVIGPDGLIYLTDHHHLGLAYELAGGISMQVVIQANWSKYALADFWDKMKAAPWVWLEDASGRLHSDPSDLPSHLSGLQNDIYRSLAWGVRDRGGYLKTTVPYADFAWADFFRTRVPALEDGSDFDSATEIAASLAHSPEAASLPGYLPAGQKTLALIELQ